MPSGVLRSLLPSTHVMVPPHCLAPWASVSYYKPSRTKSLRADLAEKTAGSRSYACHFSVLFTNFLPIAKEPISNLRIFHWNFNIINRVFLPLRMKVYAQVLQIFIVPLMIQVRNLRIIFILSGFEQDLRAPSITLDL